MKCVMYVMNGSGHFDPVSQLKDMINVKIGFSSICMVGLIWPVSLLKATKKCLQSINTH